MHKINRGWIAGAAGIVAILVVPQPVAGQLNLNEIHAQANRLHDVAFTLDRGHLSDIPYVAQQHQAAADMRLISDPRAVECTRLQAALLYHSGRLDEAQAQFEHAAALAMAGDDYSAAALSFIDAGFVAKEAGRNDDVYRLAESATRLSRHPAVDREARIAIQQRLPTGFSGR